MICPNCNSNQSDNAKFCENCGAPLSSEQNLIAQSNTVSQSGQNLPWYLSMPFIIALLFVCLVPVSIVLYIIRLDKTKNMPEKRKTTIRAGIIALAVFILFGTISAIMTFEKSPEQELRDINAAITSSDYQKAEELINEAYSDGSVSNDIIYAKFELYEKQGLFDKAADALIEYCGRFDDKTTIPDKVINKINEIKGLCESETTVKLDNVINDINTQKQAKADAEAKAKAEAEEKAKQEAEAKAKAEAEAEAAKAKAEAEAEATKAAAEEKAAAEAAHQAKAEAEKNAFFCIDKRNGAVFLDGYFDEDYNVNINGFNIYNLSYSEDLLGGTLTGYARNDTSKRKSFDAKVRFYNSSNVQISSDFVFEADIDPGKTAQFEVNFISFDALYFDIIDDAW